MSGDQANCNNLSTRVAEHISGRPVSSEVSLHQHVATKEIFKTVLRRTHTKIEETVIYKAVPIDRCLNANRPGFELKLF